MFTHEEFETYYKIKDYFTKEDIKCRCENEPTEEELNTICERVNKCIEHCDGYWEYYWNIVETEINDFYRGE